MSGGLRTRLGRLEAEVEPFRPPRTVSERSVVLLGPNDEEPTDLEAGVKIIRLTFDPGAAPPDGADAIRPDGSLDLKNLSDEQLAELAGAVAKAEGKTRTTPIARKVPPKRSDAKPLARAIAKAEPEKSEALTEVAEDLAPPKTPWASEVVPARDAREPVRRCPVTRSPRWYDHDGDLPTKQF